MCCHRLDSHKLDKREALLNSWAACEWMWAPQGGEQRLLMCHSYRHSRSCTCTVPAKPLPENWCSFILTHWSRARAFLGFQNLLVCGLHSWAQPIICEMCSWCLITKALPVHGLSKPASKTTAAMYSKSSGEVSLSVQESLLGSMYSHGKVLDLEIITH